MTCGCEYDSCHNLRKRCWSCQTNAYSAEKMAEAAARIESAMGPEAERDRRLGKAVRRAVDAHGGGEYLATHASRASASSFDSARILEAIAAALRAEEEVSRG